MEILQTGIESLFKSSATEPWKMTFVSPVDGSRISAVLGKGGNVEVGPRFKEVLSSIERYQVYPRTVMGEELEVLGMTTRDSFVVKVMAGVPVHIEIGFRPYRRFLNPTAPKVKGVLGEVELEPIDTFSIMETKKEDKKLGSTETDKTNNPVQGGEIIEVKYEKSGSNQIDYMEAYDDRFDKLFTNGLDHNVRIGDVMLVIPPLAIEVNRVSTIRKIKTLRSKSSMMIKGGSSATTITLQLYFHDLDSINGHKKKMHKDLDRNYYLDGLRPLISQFKKAPFLPIDNKYINEILGIDSVALVNLAVQSVPGFPHSLSATLTLAKFDHQAYMPQLSHLGLGMHYPMFRWYYQEPMRDDISDEQRSPYRTYLKPIPEEGLTNDFGFLIAKEEELAARKQALRDLRQMTNPIIAEEKFLNPGDDGTTSNSSDAGEYTQLGREYKDGVAAQKALDQYNRYKKVKSKISKDRTSNGQMKADDRISLTENFNKKAKEVYKDIYGDVEDRKIRDVSHYAPFESWIHFNETIDGAIGDEHSWPEKQQGSFKLRLYASNNMKLIDEKYKAGKDGDLTVYIFPGTMVDIVKKIASRGANAKDSYQDKVDEYNAAKAKVEASEGDLQLVDAGLSGELIPTSVAIMYENQFSNIQLQALEAPSFQFLGGQDPYINVTFEADETAVQSVRDMLETVEDYSREYRTGITSGFLGVENHLMQLFGVTTVMPETVQFRTVPGFPGRYQIDMTLCGFNKTQKRTEQLEGLSPIYGGTVDRESREISNYVDGADEAIIEMQMRDLELYPDLELPTYDELISALPYLGGNVKAYENRTGGKYVDPDFYMATPVTSREIIREESKLKQELAMSDFMGVEMTTNSQSPNPLDGEADMWDLLKSVDARTSRVPVNFSWGGSSENSAAENADNTKDVQFQSEAVKEYLKDREKLKEPPAYEVWKSWGLGKTKKEYSAWKEKGVDPTEAQVYKKIYEMVDKLWVDQGFVYNDKNIDHRNTTWQKVTYAKPPDLWDASWNYLASKDPKALKSGQKKEHKTTVSAKDWKATKNKVPRERIANIIKAVAHARSKWKQMYATGMPMLDAQGNAAGIMGVPLSSEAKDIETAKRLLWDWKYNMEFGVRQLFEAYTAARDKKDLEYKCRPWEWMVAAYATGTIEGTLRNDFWQQVAGILASYYTGYDKIYGTPTTSMNIDIMQAKNGYSDHQMGIIKGDKDELIKELLDMGYRRKTKDNWIREDEYASKADTKTWLEGKSASAVKKIYDDYAESKFSSTDPKNATGTENSMAQETAKGYQDMINKEELPDNAEVYEEYEEASTYIDNQVNNRLVQSTDPQDIFPEMFTDIIQYDQRMRLLRAFPTFQMFIVDEGKWMTNYRLWDNLYGFNAIQSIDIHKSRKISADTAIIQMTNVYSNLTARSMDTTYDEWDYKFWDNLVFGNPNEQLLEARKELLNSMLLQTGARIHLRLGYGSSATDLPVVFNGTITELNADEMVEIVCQGDGIELGNVISGDPGDANKSFLKGVTEPRDLICEIMTSKGNWMKDIINAASDGSLYKDNPLGIMHFGQPGSKVPEGTWKFFNDNYGETAQNIYSSNGIPSFSQWTMPDGSDIPFSFTGTPILKWLQPGDEMNVVVPFYNNTPWDIFQTLAYCSPDYMCAVHPFEMRSTLFFGKPYWSMAYKYDSKYEYDKEQKAWIRYRDLEHRKPYSQVHIFNSFMDIVGNGIKASEEGVYTNVIVNYDGKQVGPIYADFDIRFDKQKTTVVDAQIMSRISGMDFWTSEKQALYYGISAVRDYMKDMYKGELVVLGDPCIKPHDICYMQDTMYDMNGNFMVKAVTHQFSHETGFITSIQPDALAVSDDLAILSISNWSGVLATKVIGNYLAFQYGAKVMRKLVPSSIAAKAMTLGGKASTSATQLALANLAKMLPDDDKDVAQYKKILQELRDMGLDHPQREAKIKSLQNAAKKVEAKLSKWDKNGMFVNEDGVKVKGLKGYSNMKRTVSVLKQATNALTDGAKAFKLVRGAGMALMGLNPLSLLASALFTWATETISEKYRRKKAMMQAVLVMPLMYQGRQYTAGINGHKGMVVGDPMGKVDSFMSGMGFNGKNDEGAGDFEWVMDTWNWLTDANAKDYSVSEEDIMSGNYKKNQ